MKKITLKQILIIHEYQIEKHGGSIGIRDVGMLKSAVGRPFATFGGLDLYPDIYTKTGALIHSIVKNHPFLDGNKRTAFVSAVLLLKINSIELKVDQKKVVLFMIRIANENMPVDEISSWLKKHSQKI